MEKQAPTQTHQNKTSRKPAEPAGAQITSEAGLAPLVGFDQALTGSDGHAQNQADRLSDRRIAPIQRTALANRIGRLQGNRHLQQILTGLGQPYGVVATELQSPVIQRQSEEESDKPTPAQKAAAIVKAKAAESHAGQSARKAKTETSQSRKEGNTEKKAGQAQKQKAKSARSAAKSIRGKKGKKRPSAVGKGTPGAKGGPAVAGAGAAVPEVAPASPEEDPAFQKVVGRVKVTGARNKKHAPAHKEAASAQNAAEIPAQETAGRAQSNQTGAMDAAPAPGFNGAAFKAALMARIAALAPRTTSEADNFKGSGKLSSVKSEMSAKAGQETAAARGPLETATNQAPNTSAVPVRPARPLHPPAPGPAVKIAGAASAAPKSKTSAEVEKPIHENTQSIDDQMKSADVTEEQLANSNEPEFQQALDARQEAKTQAETGPQLYRQGEQEILQQAKAEAAGVTQSRTQTMHTERAGLLTQVGAQQSATKSKDEQERQRVGAEINTIYEETKSKVESILSGLDGKVSATFDQGAAEANQAFEDYVDARMEAYKERRYGGWFGWARWAKDKVLGMPSEVNSFYTRGRQLFIEKMDAVIDNVVAIIGAGLAAAKAEIANGKKRIQEYLAGLPENLQQVGQQAAQEIQGKFDSLESSVDSKQDELIDTLAKKYNDKLAAVDARIEELKAANQGLVQKALNAVVGAIKIIIKLKDMLLSVLSRVAGVIGEIIKHPIKFLGNLIKGITLGFKNFAGRIKQHLISGLVGWLTGALGPLGIKLPDDIFSLEGIFSLVVQVLGLTWENIRAKAVKLLGEPTVQLLEKSFDVFKILITKGPAGLWEFLKEQFSDLKETVIGAIQDMLESKVVQAGIEWIMGLLTPAGAFIKAAKAIYKIVMFFVEKGSQVIELVNSVIDGIAAVASGAVGGAASLIENALARALPLVIGFLASLLGLDDLAEKVQKIVKSIRTRVDRAIDWVLEKARKAAGPLLAKLGIGKDIKEINEKLETSEEKVGQPADKTAEKPDELIREVKGVISSRSKAPFRDKTEAQGMIRDVYTVYHPKGLKSLRLVKQKGSKGTKYEVVASASPNQDVGDVTISDPDALAGDPEEFLEESVWEVAARKTPAANIGPETKLSERSKTYGLKVLLSFIARSDATEAKKEAVEATVRNKVNQAMEVTDGHVIYIRLREAASAVNKLYDQDVVQLQVHHEEQVKQNPATYTTTRAQRVRARITRRIKNNVKNLTPEEKAIMEIPDAGKRRTLIRVYAEQLMETELEEGPARLDEVEMDVMTRESHLGGVHGSHK